MTRTLVGQFTLAATENSVYSIAGVDLGIVTADTFNSAAMKSFYEGYGAVSFKIAENTVSGGLLVLDVVLDWENGGERAIITNGAGYALGIGIQTLFKAIGYTVDWQAALIVNAIALFATKYAIQPAYDSIYNTINSTKFNMYDDGTIDVDSKITNVSDMHTLIY